MRYRIMLVGLMLYYTSYTHAYAQTQEEAIAYILYGVENGKPTNLGMSPNNTKFDTAINIASKENNLVWYKGDKNYFEAATEMKVGLLLKVATTSNCQYSVFANLNFGPVWFLGAKAASGNATVRANINLSKVEQVQINTEAAKSSYVVEGIDGRCVIESAGSPSPVEVNCRSAFPGTKDIERANKALKYLKSMYCKPAAF